MREVPVQIAAGDAVEEDDLRSELIAAHGIAGGVLEERKQGSGGNGLPAPPGPGLLTTQSAGHQGGHRKLSHRSGVPPIPAHGRLTSFVLGIFHGTPSPHPPNLRQPPILLRETPPYYPVSARARCSRAWPYGAHAFHSGRRFAQPLARTAPLRLRTLDES